MPPAVHPYSSSRQRLRHSLIGGSKRRLKSLEGFVSKGSETATSFTVKLPGKTSSDMRPGPSAGRGRPPGADSMRPWCRPGPRYSAEINHIDMCCISRPALPLFLPCEAIGAGAFFPSSLLSEPLHGPVTVTGAEYDRNELSQLLLSGLKRAVYRLCTLTHAIAPVAMDRHGRVPQIMVHADLSRERRARRPADRDSLWQRSVGRRPG